MIDVEAIKTAIKYLDAMMEENPSRELANTINALQKIVEELE